MSSSIEALQQRLEQVEAEREALAARNAELHDVAGILLCIDQCETCREEGEFNRDGVKRAINREAPARLARRDARVKAEALRELAKHMESNGYTDEASGVRSYASSQQAEGGGDE